MWWYYAIGAICILAITILFFLYEGYIKIHSKIISGVWCPPLSHQLLGHHDLFLHPLKHELRLQISDSTDAPVHQLVMIKRVALFLNDLALVEKALSLFSCKGAAYHSLRYDPYISDLFTSDGIDYEKRKKVLTPAILTLRFDSHNSLIAFMTDKLTALCDSKITFDLSSLLGEFILKLVILEGFGEDINTIEIDGGQEVISALQTMADFQLNSGIYDLPNAKKIPSHELLRAKEIWRTFLVKLVEIIKKNKRGPIGAAIFKLLEDDSYSDLEAVGDLHQIVKHSVDFLSGELWWLVFCLYKNPQVKQRLQYEATSNKESLSDSSIEYADAVIKELLRRYPVSGNMTARTVDRKCEDLIPGVSIPIGATVHAHIYSHHMGSKMWSRARDFIPERWLDGEYTCPFAKGSGDHVSENSASYFPFSKGVRACSGESFALSVLRECLKVFVNFNSLPVCEIPNEELGISMQSTIIPSNAMRMVTVVRSRRRN